MAIALQTLHLTSHAAKALLLDALPHVIVENSCRCS